MPTAVRTRPYIRPVLVVAAHLTAAHIALCSAAVGILPIIAIAAVYQFSSERFLASLTGFTTPPSLRFALASLIVAASLDAFMIIGWFNAALDLANDRNESFGWVRDSMGCGAVLLIAGTLSAVAEIATRTRAEWKARERTLLAADDGD